MAWVILTSYLSKFISSAIYQRYDYELKNVNFLSRKFCFAYLKTIAVNKVTNRWRNHNNKTTKISELNKIIELYEL